jgi:hypothetical protein
LPPQLTISGASPVVQGLVRHVQRRTFALMQTKRVWLGWVTLALMAGCAQTGSTSVRIAPVTDGAQVSRADYSLRLPDGTPVGRLSVIESGALREAPGRSVVHVALTVENESGRPLLLPSSELYLTSLAPDRVMLTELDGQPADTELIVAPGERRMYDLAFVLASERSIDQVKAISLHWAVRLDSTLLAQQSTVLAAIEKSRIYPRDNQAKGLAPQDSNQLSDMYLRGTNAVHVKAQNSARARNQEF